MKELKQYIDKVVSLPSRDWQVLAGLFKEKVIGKEDFFSREGQHETQIGFLVEGVMRAFYRNHEGTEYNKTFFVPVEFIGPYTALVTGKENKIGIQALTAARLYVATYREITALYDAYPMIERMSRILAEHFYAYKERREIENVLMEAGARYELFKKEYPGLESLIPQYHIASYLGITPTQLSRIRAKK